MTDSRHRLARITGSLALAATFVVAVAAPAMAVTPSVPHAGTPAARAAVSHPFLAAPDPFLGHGARKVAFYASPAYTCALGAQPAAGAARKGFAILNTTGRGYLEVTVVLKGATASTTYDVWVNQDPGACPLSAPTRAMALKTNARGNGAAHVRVQLVPGATHFWVSAVSTTDVLRTPAASLVLKHTKA